MPTSGSPATTLARLAGDARWFEPEGDRVILDPDGLQAALNAGLGRPRS